MTGPLQGCKVQPKFHSAKSSLERLRISWNSAETCRKCCLCSLSSAHLPGVLLFHGFISHYLSKNIIIHEHLLSLVLWQIQKRYYTSYRPLPHQVTMQILQYSQSDARLLWLLNAYKPQTVLTTVYWDTHNLLSYGAECIHSSELGRTLQSALCNNSQLPLQHCE